MKTIRKNIITSLFAIAAFSLVSCEKMLDTEQHGVETLETFYRTDSDAESAVTTLYLYYSNSGAYYNIYFLKNLLADDYWCGGGGRGDNAENEKLNEFTFDAEHAYINAAFQTFYSVVYRANLIIANVPGETPVQQRAIAEAKVFRALAYIDLISMWGTPPLVDHPLTPSEYKKPNGDPAALWALVESDLTEAIASGALSEKANATDNSSYRVTKQFAQALLGKALVFQGKFAEAIASLDAVISSQKYELLPGNQYENILQYTHENNSESVFELNYLNDPQNTAFLNLLFAMTGWRTDHMSLAVGTDIYSGTWGYCNPQKELYDAFVAEEGENGLRLNHTMKTYAQIQALGHSVTQEMIGHEGYFKWKDRKVSGEINSGGWMDSHNNIRIMRYSEVLLLAAEAHLKGGGSQAANYVNQVRTRAGLNTKGTVTEEDIRLEKRLELCGEGVRFQDMLRWRIADKLSAQGTNTPWFGANGTVRWQSYNNNTTAGFKERHWLLPFPQAELTNNKEIDQNKDW
ncbi:MAG: RagB/SusD family nutrient uptake outer membrane protein [Prevotellaceae bacterium]|nr:RagB/SusD family nutrient uptake outer membrane protein [Prevotellaceae bacterium]